jgi:peptidoglycan/LPS O-acetylase OafA/YrhL
VAVLAVLGFHLIPAEIGLSRYLWRYGVHLNVGVHIFFVISGFLIYSPFVRAHLAGRDGPGLRAYAWRRVLRIYPAYLAAFAIMLAFGWIRVGTARDAVAHLTLTHTYMSTGGLGILQSWSLVVEVSFYLLVPLWALGVRRLARGFAVRTPQWRIELLAAGALVPLGVAGAWLTIYHHPPRALTVLPPALAALGSGMVMAVVAQARNSEPRIDRALQRLPRAEAWWLAAIAVFFVSTLVRYDLLWASPGQRMWQACWQPVIAVLVVAPAALGVPGRGVVRRILTSRPVVGIGLVSYGIYLWQAASLRLVHESWSLASALADAGVVVAATVALGWASYVVIERPALRRVPRGRRREPVAGAP